MAFLKHIGKHGDRKVAVIFRQIPGDDHMCLCIYPDLLAISIHDPLMKVLESTVGQSAEEFADALNCTLAHYLSLANIMKTIHSFSNLKLTAEVRIFDFHIQPKWQNARRIEAKY